MASSVDGSVDLNKQPMTKWTSRPTSISMSSSSTTKPPRMVDRELQRIKSLAMVSGISRSFTQEPQSITIVSSGPSPTPSVSSSTSYNHSHRPATISSFTDMRLGTSARSHRSSSVSSYHSRGGGTATGAGATAAAAATTTTATANVSSSSSPTRKQHRQLKQAELDEIERELIEMFEDAYRTQQQDRVEHWVSTVALRPPPSDACSVLSATAPDEQSAPISRQRLIRRSQQRRDSVMSSDDDDDVEQPLTSDQRVKELETEYATATKRLEHAEQQHAQWARHIQEVLSTQLAEKETEARKARQLADLVIYQERLMAEMQRDLDRRVDIQELEHMREAVGQLWAMIDILTDTKTGIQHAIDRVQREQDAGQRELLQTQAALREVAAEVEVQRIHIEEKIIAMKRQLEEKKQEDEEQRQQQRMSIMSTNTSLGGGSRTARYAGGPLPPAAPPPTDPLPPVPVTPSETKVPSIYSSSSIITHDNASSVLFDDQQSERTYREFAEQLQTRLSVSKEIDDLQLWQSEDFEEFERRMHEKYKDIDADKRQSFIHSLRSKEGATFWRGMKKKLRV